VRVFADHPVAEQVGGDQLHQVQGVHGAGILKGDVDRSTDRMAEGVERGEELDPAEHHPGGLGDRQPPEMEGASRHERRVRIAPGGQIEHVRPLGQEREPDVLRIAEQ